MKNYICIDGVKTEIKLEKQPKKPEIRHGDYNRYELFLKRAPWIGDNEETHQNFPVTQRGALINILADNFALPVLGNIFDDIKAKDC